MNATLPPSAVITVPGLLGFSPPLLHTTSQPYALYSARATRATGPVLPAPGWSPDKRGEEEGWRLEVRRVRESAGDGQYGR